MLRALLFALVAVSSAARPATEPPPRSVRDILEQVAQARPADERAAALRTVLERAPAPGLDPKALAKHQLARADAAEALGDLPRQIALLAEVVSLGGAEDRLWEMDRLAIAHLSGGDFASAIEWNGRAIDGTGNAGPRLVSRQGIRALMLALQGNLDEAEKYMAAADGTYASLKSLPVWDTWGSIWTVNTAQPRSLILMSRGRLPQAEAEARRALAAAEEDVTVNRTRLARRFATPAQHFVESRRDQVLDQLARILALQGRGTEAEVVARRALAGTVAREGGYSAQGGQRLMHLAVVLLYEGRFAESGALAEASLDVLRRAGSPESSFFVFTTRRVLASALAAQGRHADAMAEYRRLADIYKGAADMEAHLAAGDVSWTEALLLSGDAAGALAMAGRLLPNHLKWMGEGHIDTATLRGLSAMALARLGRTSEAWREFSAAMPVLVREATGAGEEASLLQVRRLRTVLEGYLDFLGDARGSAVEREAGADFAAEAFRVADVLRSQGTQLAVAASAARAAAGESALGGEIRREQDLNNELGSLYRILRGLVEAPPARQLPRVMADMQQRIEAIKREQLSLREDIARRFPAYANLTRPQPPTLAQARAALRPGEALLALFTTERSTLVWAAAREGEAAFVRAAVGSRDMAERVARLRRALDPGDVDLARMPVFDLDTAHRLYRELLEPAAQGWQGATSLLVTVNGALSQIPFAILPTTAAPAGTPGGEVQWLLRKAAIAHLPSVNTLLTLRSRPAGGADRRPFVGFGDPQFTAAAAARPGTLRNLAAARGTAEAWMDYAKLPPLPDTREEILAVAKVLSADPARDVFLGAEASLANLRKLDLSSRRIVAFATHGLLPGEFPGVSEPSLALANPGDGRHGLLALEDILKLKLDADWVVLSACNTAAGDGAGADAISGLGRGFFYAGSRALLVTHWPVETVSARLLVTGVFERYARDPALSRTEALRQSMLALLDAKPESARAGNPYAHPLFWAPYVLVGDGGPR